MPKDRLPPPAWPRRRGLVLAGGGLKAAYAAGVLEQLLPALGHKADQTAFSHVEACSSGIFNAAMMGQGREGPEIGQKWRSYRPLRALSVNWSQLIQLFWAESLFTFDRMMDNVVLSKTRHGWGLTLPFDACDPDCTYRFNAYDFTSHAVVSFAPNELEENQFLACVALPRWFPPVALDVDEGKVPGPPCAADVIGDLGACKRKHVFVDAVFATDSNAAVLVEADLDEIWVIWTVDVRGQWRDGWVNNYFRLLEQAAASAYRRERQVICDAGFTPANTVDAGAPCPPKILYEIAGDVPHHYLFGFTRGGVCRAVDQGAADAWAYLDRHRGLWGQP
jgi:predicted acylesterase/phospholipase RssA